MKPSAKLWIRPLLLLLCTLSIVRFFYLGSVSTQSVLSWFYNIFAGLVLLAAVLLYGAANHDAYWLKSINKHKVLPSEHKKWKPIWDQYHDGFLTGHQQTTEPARSFFSPEQLLSASTERFPVLAILKAMPGTYTGLGILGTFIGFSAGLRTFDVSSTETMQESIKALLSGIDTAFNTSIVGVVLSILFNFIFLQPLVKRLESECDLLSDRLDSLYYVDAVDHLTQQLSFQDEGKTWLPGECTRELLKEQRSQSASLAHFTTDLSDSMQNLAESLVSSYRQEMIKMLNEQLRPILERLAVTADRLQEEKAESADQTMNNIIARLEQALTSFMEDFKENVAGETKKEMENMAGNIHEAGKSISAIPKIMEDLQNTFGSMTGQFVKAINDVTLEGTTLQAQTIDTVRALNEDVKRTMESFSRTLQAAEAQNRHAQKIAENLEEVSDATGSAANDLSRTFKEHSTRGAELLSALGKEADSLRSGVLAIESVVQGFHGLDQSLSKSFETINSGLTQYNETTKDGLSSQLEKYSSTIGGFSERLAGAVEQLSEMVEELTEATGQVKR